MILVDEPRWPARGRLWSHLVSDVSYAELHAFAEMLGAPRRAFDRDHYDIPDARFPMALWLGATLVRSRELSARLRAAGLRRPKHLSPGSRVGPGLESAQVLSQPRVLSSAARFALAVSSQAARSGACR
ncbi:DUF4031 domain-containing protein [Actinoplanes sp. ATCC 53533]|uniref:DUF4031 domain-containing protein n=1 Tax=Actinoplanes sp. ATCC 53533 TaxID=1288362 RepID=UPI000F779491|nr:DUF4031 domain-containing protein [Actinoplanes sp. ATCC 53533]RSM46577.1 DUF4031 domain-containing protein [Actinoplanes sp. ATCC 53533]